ncbi:MAG: tRNA (adenosine(37)-N6)-dimethylallyltransferase MiaA [PVC group bacterium]
MDETLIILGPTAVGKTEVSILLAEKIGGEIISADAFQVYRGLDIASAKPSPRELARVPHHLIDILDLSEQYTAARFRELAGPLIAEIWRRPAVPIVVGGAGLYIRVLVDGLFPGPAADRACRDRLEREENEKGPGYLHRLLGDVDPAAARRIHPNNRKRIIRALEVYEATGIPISRWQTQWGRKDEHRTSNVQRPTSNDTGQRAERKEPGALLAGKKPTTAHCPMSTAYIMVGLRRDRDDLYARINRRAEEMFERGLVEETGRLLERGIRENRIARQALGCKEAIGYLSGEYSREEAVRRLAANTRHLARRQLTWWRKDQRIRWVDLAPADQPEDALAGVMDILDIGKNQFALKRRYSMAKPERMSESDPENKL